MAVLCKNCSGKLIFNPASQLLECKACGGSFRPEDIRDINAEAHSKYYDTRVYVCGHCGAEVITNDTEASTLCVYCGNPAIVFSRIAKQRRPDGLIPFKITKEQALDRIKNKLFTPLTPKEVKDKATFSNLRGIYVPYWVLNADFTEADYITGEISVGRTTIKKHYSRAGSIRFNNVPIDGSKILNDNISMRLEPLNLDEAKEFDEDYLNGFYSNISDTSYEELKGSAANRCHKIYSDHMLKSIPARNAKIDDSVYWIDIHDDPVYMMMPVWFFSFRYQDKPYTVLVNGQTGEVVGTIPWEKKQVYKIAGGIFAAVMVTGLALYSGISFSHAGINGMLNNSASALVIFGLAAFPMGLIGIQNVLKKLSLAQSEEMFKFVKKRQG